MTRAPLVELVQAIPEFDDADRAVATELIDAALAGSPDYQLLVDPEARGYLCYGPTPMTLGTFDLYWIAVHPRARRAGVARELLRHLDEALRERGARMVRVETNSNAVYEPTRAFYDRNGFREEARLRDFYKPGDDLVIYVRRL